MKKIIELASEFLDYDVFAGERTNDIMARLKSALVEYKRLSETPITEDWLKEHGFTMIKHELSGGIIVSHFQKGQYEEGGEIRVFVEDEHTMQIRKRIHDGRFINVIIPHHSLADLYDALELCGINLEN